MSNSQIAPTMPTIIKYDPRFTRWGGRFIPVSIETYLLTEERDDVIASYNLLSKKELIKYCKGKGWKKYSKYKKKELVIWIVDKKIEESRRLINL